MSMPVMQEQCGTCPFKDGGWEYLQPLLMQRAIAEGTPICHSTGPGALVPKIKDPHICAGARKFQLHFWASIGFIASPTEEAWAAKCDEMGIENISEEAACQTSE